MKDWYVGMEVVCIDNRPRGQKSNAPLLEVGKVYKIRAFDLNPPLVMSDILFGPCLYVEGITCGISALTGKELSFYWWRFKPVVKPKKEEDISVFQKILDTINVKEPETV